MRGAGGEEEGGKGERERERESEREREGETLRGVVNTQENIRIPKRKNHKLKGILKPWEPGTVTSTIPFELSHTILHT